MPRLCRGRFRQFRRRGVSMGDRSVLSSTHDMTSDLISTLVESGLVSGEEVDKAQCALSTLGRPTDGAVLAQHLVDTGRLTEYQLKMVRAGKVAELVMGNYEVLDRLGAGGMGAVFKARPRGVAGT